MKRLKSLERFLNNIKEMAGISVYQNCLEELFPQLNGLRVDILIPAFDALWNNFHYFMSTNKRNDDIKNYEPLSEEFVFQDLRLKDGYKLSFHGGQPVILKSITFDMDPYYDHEGDPYYMAYGFVVFGFKRPMKKFFGIFEDFAISQYIGHLMQQAWDKIQEASETFPNLAYLRTPEYSRAYDGGYNYETGKRIF